MIFRNKTPYLLLPLIAGIVIFLYFPALKGDFYVDDFPAIVHNTSIKNITALTKIFDEFNTRFLTGLSFAVNFSVHKLYAPGFRFTNILLHLLNSFLIYIFISKVLTSLRRSHQLANMNLKMYALFSSLIFLLHPLQTQAVNYIWQRSILLLTFFYVLTLILYIKSSETKNKTALLFMYFFLTCALFTHELSITLPFAILLIMYLILQKRNVKSFGLMLFSFIPLLVYVRPHRSASRFFLSPVKRLQESAVAEHTNYWELLTRWSPSEIVNNKHYFLTEIHVFWEYIRLLFLPLHLNFDYTYPLVTSFFNTQTIIYAFLILGLCTIAIMLRKKYVLLSFSILWFFLTISLMLLFPSEILIAEHRTYLSLIGFSIFLTELIFRVFPKPKIQLFIFASLISVYSLMTFSRNHVYQSPHTLWSDVIIKSPKNARALANLAQEYSKHNDLPQAEKLLLKALKINPDYYEIYNNLGVLYAKKNEFTKAETYYKKALWFEPHSAALLNNLGNLAFKNNDLREAEVFYKKAIHNTSPFPQPFYNLADIYIQENHTDSAFDLYEEVANLYPEETIVYLKLINLALKTQNNHKAIKYSKHLLNHVSDSEILTDTAVNIAPIHIDLSLRLFEKSLQEDLRNTHTYIKLGLTLKNLNNQGKARRVWLEGKRLFPEETIFDTLLLSLDN